MNVTPSSFQATPNTTNRPAVRFSGWEDEVDSLRELLRGRANRRPVEPMYGDEGDSYSFGNREERSEREIRRPDASAASGPSRTQLLANDLRQHLADAFNLKHMADNLPESSKRAILCELFSNPATAQTFVERFDRWVEGKGLALQDDSKAALMKLVFATPPGEPRNVDAAVAGMKRAYAHADEEYIQEAVYKADSITAREILKILKPMPQATHPNLVDETQFFLQDGFDAYHAINTYGDLERTLSEFKMEALPGFEPQFFKPGKLMNRKSDYPLEACSISALAPKESEEPLRWVNYTKQGNEHTLEWAKVERERVRYYRYTYTDPRFGEPKDPFDRRGKIVIERINRILADAWEKKVGKA